VKRLALLMTGGAIWLFLAALPALADGGPHVSTINNGSLGINADSCAGCHRAHTAQGPYLINAADEEALCLTCHGATSVGSTVDVMTGVQYTLDGGLRGDVILGAARNGGFDQARIGSSVVYRIANATGSLRTKVPVLADPVDVTSAHLALAENGLVNPGIAWGNGGISATADPGPVVDLSCGSCHNPHGNGQYRILNPLPEPAGTGFEPAAAPVAVNDAPLPPAGDTRNYTVIQVAGPSYLLLASDVEAGGYAPTAGDYLHRRVPWNTGSQNDAPNGQPATFNSQIANWCATCHTRYYDDVGFSDTGDAIFKYRHVTTGRQACTTCHVSHGSNAQMSGTFSSIQTHPDGAASGSSRLLKIDNRGTCQACHDPTGTTVPNTSVGPVPVPIVP
jgi:predicted CXXCH cytochrome family protein